MDVVALERAPLMPYRSNLLQSVAPTYTRCISVTIKASLSGSRSMARSRILRRDHEHPAIAADEQRPGCRVSSNVVCWTIWNCS